MSNTNEIRNCVDCQREYEITEGWRKKVEETPDFQLPKRCYDCRQKRKKEKQRFKTTH